MKCTLGTIVPAPTPHQGGSSTVIPMCSRPGPTQRVLRAALLRLGLHTLATWRSTRMPAECPHGTHYVRARRAVRAQQPAAEVQQRAEQQQNLRDWKDGFAVSSSQPGPDDQWSVCTPGRGAALARHQLQGRRIARHAGQRPWRHWGCRDPRLHTLFYYGN